MKGVVGSLAMFALATAVSAAGWWIARNDRPLDLRASLGAGGGGTASASRYRLQDLELANAVLAEVRAQYVEPERVHPEDMYAAALDAVEREVPTVLFRRVEGSRLVHVQIGDHLSVVEVPPLTSTDELLLALGEVARLLAAHVDPEDVQPEGGASPLATIEFAMVNGMLDTLDPHSRLLPPEDSAEMDLENAGEFGGLGITIVEREGVLTVDYPLPDTPAAQAGLLADDRILRIDGESTINMSLDEAVSRLRGPVGAAVTLHVGRNGVAETFDVKMVRDRIKINPVEGDLLEGGIAIVSIKSFHANVAADLEGQLARLSRMAPGGRLAGLILDLRGNPGGYLTQAVLVADRFLEEGMIVSSVGRGREAEREEATAPRTEPRYPIAVLLSAGSASASEIVAGALRNNERAVIIGERSFGKGSVQNLEGYDDGSKLKLTIAKYYTPGNKSIQAVGIPADLELLPVVVKPADGDSLGSAMFYWRERVRREADLDNRLDVQAEGDDRAIYSLRYLRPSDLRRKDSSLRHLRADPEVRFARDVLVAAGGRHRRPDVLVAAHPVVSTWKARGGKEIEAAFQQIGVDWSDGPSAPAANLDVKLDLGSDGALQAGESETIWLEVTNRGPSTLYRLAAVSSSEAEILDGREFFFGKLLPGQTARYAHEVLLNEGYATERSPVSVTFRDGGNDNLTRWESELPVSGTELPMLSWTYRIEDRGDGDGVPEVGENLRVVVDVTNEGPGPTAEAFVRARNQSRRAVELQQGTIELGTAADTTGSTGASPSPGRIAPGQTAQGTFDLTLQEAGPWKLELTVGDARAYDHTTVMRAGFYDTFTNKVEILVPVGEPLAGPVSAIPPRVEVTRSPDLVVEGARVTVSGKVTDDVGIAHVTVWRGDEKVALADGGGNRSIPFSADVELEEGLNTLVVVATDVGGLTRTWSVITTRRPVVADNR
jgi:carboxyl-terminal processing protease